MANDLNQCNFIGRLGRDVEVRTFPSGDQVANATLAVGSKWRDKNTGETNESTEWVRLVFNGKLAVIASQYLRKGSQIHVTGQMRTREWEQDGVKRYSTEIRVDQMQMLGGKPQGDGGSDQGSYGGYDDHPRQQPRQAAPAQGQRRAPPAGYGGAMPQPRASGGFSDMEDDIPFIDPLRLSSPLHTAI